MDIIWMMIAINVLVAVIAVVGWYKYYLLEREVQDES